MSCLISLKSEENAYVDQVQIRLNHSRLYLSHLSALFQSLLRGQVCPEVLLTIASSLVENSYLIWEQMGMARMGLLEYDRRETHGLFPLYPKTLREQLGITDLIRELSYANNWTRYPEETFNGLQTRSTLGGTPLVPEVFRSLMASSTKTTLPQTKLFVARALEIAEKTLVGVEPLIQVLEGLVNGSNVALDPLEQAFNTTLSRQIDVLGLKEIEKIWNSALGVHADVWKVFQDFPQIADIRHKERSYYLRQIIGDIKRLQVEASPSELTQISCHLCEKISLLIASSLRSVIEVRNKHRIYSYINLKTLLQQAVTSDELLKAARPKPGSIGYTRQEFVDLTTKLLHKANGLSRYPFRPEAVGNEWHSAMMSLLEEFHCDLATHSLVPVEELEEPLETIVKILRSTANLFRYGILPIMRNIGNASAI